MAKKITYEESLILKDSFYIDTRSPAEFGADHIPGAVNIPILNNEERAIVGTLYKQVSTEKAYEQAREYYDARIEEIKHRLKSYGNKKTLVIYCWRGGLRSKTIAELGEETGLSVLQLEGGYKSYREYVRERLAAYELKQKVVVLDGLTGTGKTELLNCFESSIDLEGLAQHRSSLFGAVGLQPRTQKHFESLLLHELDALRDEKMIFVEGESRKIGSIFMPNFLFDAMEKGTRILVTLPLEQRKQRIVKDYLDTDEKVSEAKGVLARLVKVLGKNRINEISSMLEKRDLLSFAEALLTGYYDPLYRHSIMKLDFAFEVDNSCPEEASGKILSFLSGSPII